MEKNMHKALYRIYRPTSFIDIVGQEQIISILKNQIKEGSVSHAYLFSGGRGTGKTSTAKVFAKAGLNIVKSAMCRHQQQFGLDCSMFIFSS